MTIPLNFRTFSRRFFKRCRTLSRPCRSVKLTLGEIDDLHTIYNNMTKASVAVDTFVAVKDAAVNAYNSILQITM